MIKYSGSAAANSLRHGLKTGLTAAFIFFAFVLALSACGKIAASSENIYTPESRNGIAGPNSDSTMTLEHAYKIVKNKLKIPVLKPTYLPKGFYVSTTYDVNENYGKNPRIVSPEHAEIEIEKPGRDNNSEYGHKWIRLSWGTDLDIANISTSGVYVSGKPALMIGSGNSSWSLVSWVNDWHGKRIRYAVEGGDISKAELLKIAISMKPY